MDFYFTIDTAGVAEYKDRGSKFLAYAFPLKNKEEFKKHLQILKKEHPKAARHCFAYRISNNGNNYGVSDDGEQIHRKIQEGEGQFSLIKSFTHY